MKKLLKAMLCLAMTLIMITSVFVSSSFAANYPIKDDSPLKGLRVGFYGDSICAANIDNDNPATKNIRGWAGRIGSTNQMKWANHGVGAASVSNVRGTNTIMHQLSTAPRKDYDMIILHGGTNDAWDNAPIGTMTEGFGASDSYDVTTFAGGLEQIFAFLRENTPDTTVGYIINFKFVNAQKGATKQIQDADGKTKKVYLLNYMEEYVEMTKRICDKWGVPYLDLHGNDELTEKLHPKDAKGQYLGTYVYDFIHPTVEGYDIIYPYIEEFMIDLVTEESEPPVTDPVEPSVTDPITDPVAKEEKGGCKSSTVGAASLIAVVSLAGVTLLAKKKNDDQ